jgi:hypothetical protein
MYRNRSSVEGRKRDFGFRISDFGLKNSNLNPQSRVPPGCRNPQFGHPQLPAPRPQPPRRGVLLLVVLSMLVLFMLVGTAFLMSSGQSRDQAKTDAKSKRLDYRATRQLDGALLQVLRDTDNPYSVVRYHSLLRDLYGTDGFQGVIYRPGAVGPTTAGQPTRYAGAIAGTPLGPTQGQLIDIYVRALGWDMATNASVDDPLTTINEGAPSPTQLFFPDLRHLLKLERNALGQPQLHSLPLTKGYYNGCLLTITSGAASGQTARIVDYEFIPDDVPPLISPANDPVPTRLFRFRVMAFQRADGQPLQVGTGARSPELTDLAGATFIVNGRAFSGTGVGYNQFATTGSPKLSALELFATDAAKTEFLGAEVALLPNAVYFNPLGNFIGAAPAIVSNPFLAPMPRATLAFLNDPTAATPYINYPTFAGPGGANEPYDAADFQNIHIGLQTVTPRARGRVVHSGSPNSLDVNDPTVWDGSTYINTDKFLRLDLEDLPLPSFHRPDLVNFWYHRLLGTLTNSAGPFAMSPDEAALAILDPYPNGSLRSGLNPSAAALICAIKRQTSLRPLHEDHPNFDGSNRLSVEKGLPLSGVVDPNTMSQIAVPYWEAVGPWDVDNDNDGIPDSIWVDLGDPIQEAEDGTRYKPLYAFLIIDLDSRLNVNAHGLADHLLPTAIDNKKQSFFDTTYNSNPALWPGNLAHVSGATLYSTLQLPRGGGYGPAEISLRSVFPAPLDVSYNPSYLNNRNETSGPVDSYAALLRGRIRLDGRQVSGRYGTDLNQAGEEATAGTNYRYASPPPAPPATPANSSIWYTNERATPDLAAQIKFFDYPWSINGRSGFGTPADLKARYAVGLDYSGQPVYEVAKDVNPNTALQPPAQWLPFNLLAKTPYELDLSRARRRDDWAADFPNATTAFNTSVDFSASGGQIGLNDDAPFSPTDLEKVLRAWDADSGTLPSRLWDVVSAFDPLKLYDPTKPLNAQPGDPYRVEQTSQNVFGSANAPEMLTTAQQMAGVNRRLVTTDSYSLPVQTGNFSAKLPYGADGMPGLPGVDDDSSGVVDDVGELNTKLFADGSDDYAVVMAEVRARTGSTTFQLTLPTNPQVLDYLRYRIILELLRKNFIPVGAPQTDAQVDALVSAVIVSGGLLAPEVAAGLRMDVNRPFGDGKDNSSDGVVDDPLEAGEPFLDENGNGRYDLGERFIDADRNGAYTAPGDELWQGLTAEPITFDHSNGQECPLHPKGVTPAVQGGVRSLESQGRQIYARQLYCLMLLLVDENYIAPWDENDPQLMTWMASEKAKLTAAPLSLPAEQADFIVKRKATRRTIAQWAINCVDMRDPDVIMTPFEYDENPWDGWGVPDAVVTPTPNNIPLDGDPATDENLGELIDWNNVPKGRDLVAGNADDFSKVIAPSPASPPGATPAWPAVPTLIAASELPSAVNQTRGVVWGAERPELLITETLAFHDRRTEDLISNDSNGHGEMKHYKTDQNPGGYYADPDPDQGLRPRGSLFVEVYNPWSPDGQYPAELYSRVNSSLAAADPNRLVQSAGVQLDRVSNYAIDANGNLTLAPSDAANGIKRSPVWRMIVVEEWPDARNSDDIDGTRLDRELTPGVSAPAPYGKMATDIKNWKPVAATPLPPFQPTDPDFDVAFNAGFLPKQKAMGKNFFDMQYPYVEREFYFTTDRSPALPLGALSLSKDQTPDYNYANNSFKLRIPYRTVDIKYPPTITNMKPGYTQRFIPQQLELDTTIPAVQSVVAPIMPGRYGVIGSAGTKYTAADQTYTSTVGRFDVGTTSWNTDDAMHHPLQTRRIELRPSNDPNKQQLVVATNGGDPNDVQNPSLDAAGNKQYDPTTKEIGRDNELINDQGSVKNIYLKADGTPGADFYQPTVAIPVEGMNVSEPPWGWGAREYEAAVDEVAAKGGAGGASVFRFKPDAPNKFEGRYVTTAGNKTSYDKPLDGHFGRAVAPELLRNGTTANYRTIHLQRLANPALPWNPAPGQFKDQIGNDLYRPNLPINPYRTVDSSSVDLTAFNGTTSAEANYPDPAHPDTQKQLFQKRPWETSEVNDYLTSYNADKQVFHFRSTERGGWARLNILGAAATPATSPPQRLVWAQEPARVKFKLPGATELFDLMTLRQMTMRATGEVDTAVVIPPGGSPAVKTNRCDMVFEHSLGFGNKSMGLLYDAKGSQGAKSQAPTAAAVGAPAPGDYTWDLDSKNAAVDARIKVDSTNPWLEWVNRPFVSAEELLKVPAASQSTMLRMYSTTDPSASATAPTATNAYGLAKLGMKSDATPVANNVRWSMLHVPFRQMANMFAASAYQPVVGMPLYTSGIADVVRDPATGVPVLNPPTTGEIQPYGAPSFHRILDYVRVPSRYVGIDTVLNAETFNDVPGVVDTIGTDIVVPNPWDPRFMDPRYYFQPPFNKVSRQRDPGRVNLNTVTGRRITPATATSPAQIWSDVFDGIMHRLHDANPTATQLGHAGPAWRDVVLSRRGYAQVDAAGMSVDNPPAPANPNHYPDTFSMGLNNDFPTLFANPFRSSDAGDLVPLQQMVQFGVDATLLRKHPYNRSLNASGAWQKWGPSPMNFGDARDAGFGVNEAVSVNLPGSLTIPSSDITTRDTLPLFSEARSEPFSDTDRNPSMMYQPMTRLGNLVTDRSGVYGIWITVGYFEVEPAPKADFQLPDWGNQAVRDHFGGDPALYNRTYPDGYMLGRELGSDTGDVKRPRGFYIIDRTEEVGFKPGEDLNVEKLIRLRRRIE